MKILLEASWFSVHEVGALEVPYRTGGVLELCSVKAAPASFLELRLPSSVASLVRERYVSMQGSAFWTESLILKDFRLYPGSLLADPKMRQSTYETVREDEAWIPVEKMNHYRTLDSMKILKETASNWTYWMGCETESG